ncbi:MAG: hypothetical protein SGI73_07290 [Chloroflexota bacterium]|nr:hypothetical protein [Chloroflexota bacterium]
MVKNRHHNGHPDLIPIDVYPNNAVLHGEYGIEIKASRYRSGWQGHNAEDVWLMVFVFESSAQPDTAAELPPRSFRFLSVSGAQLTKVDWGVSGRSETSRRTPTASVLRSGYAKMNANWIYRASP